MIPKTKQDIPFQGITTQNVSYEYKLVFKKDIHTEYDVKLLATLLEGRSVQELKSALAAWDHMNEMIEHMNETSWQQA